MLIKPCQGKAYAYELAPFLGPLINRAEGLKEEEKKGREVKKLEIAKQMLEDGEPMEKIKKWTGLSEAKINALK